MTPPPDGMTLQAVVIVAAVAFRLWRLVAHDRIAQPLRNRWNPATPRGELVDFFVACPWCLGTWLAIAGTLAWAAGHHLAVWEVVGLAATSSVLVGLIGDKT